MESFFIHLLKSSSILLLFLVSYHVFLKRETFFNGNRAFLLAGLFFALLLPFVTITKTVWVDPSPVVSSITTLNNYTFVQEITSVKAATPFNWYAILLTLYSLGVLYFSIRLTQQLRAIKKIKHASAIIADGSIYHVKTKTHIAPFSFFKHIFYYPKQFKDVELDTIIAHEKVHANELHSIDILLTEILFIILWFNPIIWFYKIIVKQNLEFLADAKTCTTNPDKKFYQYLMLKQAVGNHHISIANPFFNSIIKKRIVMLNQNQSKAINRIKLLIILPFLGLFLFAFNTKEVVKFSENTTPKTTITTDQPVLTNPVEQSSISKAKKHNNFNITINKNTSNKALKKIKQDLAEQDVDFSYTVVRNEKGAIINIEIDVTGKYENQEDFQLSYNANSEQPIEEILIHNNKKNKTFFIGKKENKEKLLSSNTLDTSAHLLNKKKSNAITTTSSIQITEVKIEVDKDSKNETLTKDSKFLAERGITVNFKNIKRNATGEITAIKVTYDNGNGDTGTYYQKKKNNTINPFVVQVSFKNETAPEITVGEVNTSTTVTTVYSNNDLTWESSDKNQETIKIKKEGDTEVILLNGKKISRDELKNKGEVEKFFVKVLNSTDSINADVIINRVNTENYEIINLDNEPSNTTKESYIVIKKGDSVQSKFKKIEFHKNDEDDEQENVFIINTDEAGDYNANLRIATQGKKPLYIVDGEEKESIEALDPNTIETINVLKGKMARKKYGEKGKNGVVEIVTKKEK